MHRHVKLPAAVFLLALTHPAFGQTAMEAALRANSEFGCDLYRELAKKPGNVFVSPHSVSTALAAIAAGAEGATQKELLAVLRCPAESERRREAFAKLIEASQPPRYKSLFQFHSVNDVWVQGGLEYQPAFASEVGKVYDGKVRHVDFIRMPEAARREINLQLDALTRGAVSQTLSEGSIDRKTRMIVTSFATLKTDWSPTFTSRSTRTEGFLLAPEAWTLVAVMSQQAEVPFMDGTWWKAVEFAHAQNCSLTMILPKNPAHLSELERRLTTDALAELRSGLKVQSVKMKIPRFRLQAPGDLGETLQQMGIRKAFAKNAEFGKMVESDADVMHLDRFVHIAELKFDEQGYKGPEKEEKTPPPAAAEFIATHPFLVAVTDLRTGSLIFLGRVADPR